MSFISFEYVLFFLMVVPLYFALPLRWRWVMLLVVSYIFYAFSRVEYIFLMGFTTLVDYFASRGIAALPQEETGKRRALLFTSIAVNLSVLFVFKYFNFFSDSLAIAANALNIPYDPIFHNIVLPVGISFYTFQSMSYTIDVYRGDIPVQKNPGILATYVSFFPQLVAGPIERASHIIPQVTRQHNFEYDRVVSGLRMVLWGAFKKVVIADRLAVYANAVYNQPGEYSGLPLIVATVFFAFQIYCDFSGYSDIAVGSARVLGFDLMENFRQPYLSRSVREFWRRWHISLSTWFRDYLYIPLGGNRISFGRTLLNLMIVFVVSGLWHGANWTFVIWGALHGGYIVLETVYSQWKGRPILPDNLASQLAKMALTFTVVTFAWIFFRANTVQDAGYVIAHFFDFSDGRAKLLQPLFGMRLDPRIEFLLSGGLIVFLLGAEWMTTRYRIQQQILARPVLRWTLYYAATAIILITLLNVTTEQQFIYFQF